MDVAQLPSELDKIDEGFESLTPKSLPKDRQSLSSLKMMYM